MIAVLLLAVAAVMGTAGPAPSASSLVSDADHAIDSGRLDEANLIIARAASAGAPALMTDGLLAKLYLASGKYEAALAKYQSLRARGMQGQQFCEQAALAALNLGRWAVAKPFAECAVAPSTATWRAWNARGVVADLMDDWPTADRAYAKAAELAPGRAEVLNNEGWSRLLRGEWSAALPYFEQAEKIDPASRRIENNLDLARAALEDELPARRPAETDCQWAERLNDAGLAARLVGDSKRALAAFTQSMRTNGEWDPRAAENLKAAAPQ